MIKKKLTSKNYIHSSNEAQDSNKSILFLTYTHGDEPIGYQVINRLITHNKNNIQFFDWIIGNPKAMKKSKRFIDCDLNRVAPGDPHSVKYEERRAYELVNILKQYEYVIDIHETKANNKILIIVPYISDEVLILLSNLKIRNILIWPQTTKRKLKPLMTFCKSGIGIEIGTKSNRTLTLNNIEKILELFLKRTLNKKNLNKTELNKKNFYHVYAKITANDLSSDQSLKDFKEIDGKKEKFIALLFGKHKGILGYKMKKVDIDWVINNK